MRLVSSKTLLTLATALVAVPGAAIAAAEPGEPILQVGAADAEEVDCDEYLDDTTGEGDATDEDDTTGDDEVIEDDGDLEGQAVPEECLDDDGEGEGAEDETAGDETIGDDDGDADSEDGTEGSDDETHEERELESEVEDDTGELDDGTHGEIVSTVARCAPRGQERIDGFDLPNHGAYVSAAAKGEALGVGEGYDLSTLEGATALCDDLDDARADAEDVGDDETAEIETSDVEEPASQGDAPAGPATGQQRGGESGPPEHAGNGGGAKGKGPQDAPGRDR